MERFAVKGIFVDTPTPDTLRVRDGYMLCEDGRCGAFREAAPAGVPVYDHSGQIITPGFVDLHLHAPQYSYCGTAMDLELLDWLQQYTYPEESHYADADYARAGYGYFVRDLTHSATTRACIFGTLHTDATLELMHQLKAAGLSAFVGKLGMDRNPPLAGHLCRRAYAARRPGAPDDHPALYPQCQRRVHEGSGRAGCRV